MPKESLDDLWHWNNGSLKKVQMDRISSTHRWWQGSVISRSSEELGNPRCTGCIQEHLHTHTHQHTHTHTRTHTYHTLRHTPTHTHHHPHAHPHPHPPTHPHTQARLGPKRQAYVEPTYSAERAQRTITMPSSCRAWKRCPRSALVSHSAVAASASSWTRPSRIPVRTRSRRYLLLREASSLCRLFSRVSSVCSSSQHRTLRL